MTTSGNSFKLLKAGNLIDGMGGPPVKDGAVLVQGSKIIAVGRAADIVAPEGAQAEVFDYTAKTVMPGMVDCHTHHNGFGDGRAGEDTASLSDEVLTLQAARNARSSLFTGVTTIRENGPKNTTMFKLRDAMDRGIAVGPRMVLCGRPISIIGGHMWYFGSEVTGPVEARAMVRQVIKEGADYIKITATGGSTRTSFPLLPSFNVDELLAMTDEAHKFGKLTATHCVATQGIVNSLDAGIDMIIHCVFKEPDGAFDYREDVVERIIEQGAYVNPTLHVGRSAGWALMREKELRRLTGNEQSKLDESLFNFDTRVDHCRRMIEAGAKIITGSDSSWGDYLLGNAVLETECLVMAGLSPMDGILSVTGNAAKALGVDDAVGTLEPGKEADIIIVDGDPSKQITDLWNVEEVFLGGRLIDRGSEESVAATRQWAPNG